ncbi:ZIP zinc transporter-domain-containing protein [Truncatella angustata]|uniref:ZIP zinc transporter-domain-containing protein n=1 Tax=Truncatella angustata TaxID=152316 RepID=A0A9P9A5G0_9PEZI|nr:ZIP zinc transporter-domain-containing protein [Truncatella angustata]KAH6661295.1 ZIP zinc transporter-domain-containing protein [Truncatella angustata]
MSLSQSQMRLISSIGIGILVGTSLIVIIPEGVSAISEASLAAGHVHGAKRHVITRTNDLMHWNPETGTYTITSKARRSDGLLQWDGDAAVYTTTSRAKRANDLMQWDQEAGVYAVPDKAAKEPHLGQTLPVIMPDVDTTTPSAAIVGQPREEDPPTNTPSDHAPEPPESVPTFWVGLSLILGFVLMFLIDRLPRHASDNFTPPPAPRHISLSNLGASGLPGDDEESDGFLSSLTPTPKQSRSLATTTGLVIHAAADGIAMGASVGGSDTKLGFIVFIAIMVHKAPAAFGLTSLLLKQGLSKRAARGHLIVFSLASPAGAWATFILVNLLGGRGDGGQPGEWNQWWTGMLLLFSAGTFLYVAMHAMQEGDAHSSHDMTNGNGYGESPTLGQRKQARPQMRDTIATVVGMLLPLLTQFGHHH